jgi:hypothetical protein
MSQTSSFQKAVTNESGFQYYQNPETLDEITQNKIMSEAGDYVRSQAFWYDPERKVITAGEYSGIRPGFDNHPIAWEQEGFEHVKNLVQSGNYTDAIGFKLAGYNPEYHELIKQYNDVKKSFAKGDKNALERNLQQGGTLERKDYLNIKTLQAESRLVLGKPPANILLSLADRVATTEFSFKWYTVSNAYDMVHKKIHELEVPFTGTPKFASDTASLDLYGGHIGTTWEFRNETFDVNVFDTVVQIWNGQMDRARNEALADEINAVTAAPGGGDWDAQTSNANTTNPVPELAALADNVNGTNKGTASVILSKRNVYRAYISSTPWVIGTTIGIASPIVNSIPYNSSVNFVSGTVPLFDGFRWGVDDLITAEEISVLDPSTLRFWDGPQRTLTYANTQTEIEGTIYKAYFAAKILDTDLISKNSGILSA